MRVKEISVGVSRSYNYQSFSCNLTAELSESDSIVDCTQQLQQQAKQVVEKELNEYRESLGGKK